MKKYFIITTIMLFHYGLFAQNNTNIIQSHYKNGMYSFNDSTKILTSEIFTTYLSQFGLTENDSMALINESIADSTGTLYQRYVQYNQGYMIMGTMMNVISKNGIVLFVNGFLIPGFTTNASNPINNSDALTVALQNISAPKYAWQDSTLETSIKMVINTSNGDTTIDTSRTYFPKGKLVITKVFSDTNKSNSSKYALCWQFNITPMYLDTFIIDTNIIGNIHHRDTLIEYKQSSCEIVYINAITGNFYFIDTNQYQGSYFTTGHVKPTWYDGNQDIEVLTNDWWGFTYFGVTWPRATFYDSRNIHLISPYYDGDFYDNRNLDFVEKATNCTAYWELEKAFDYFKSMQGIFYTLVEKKIYSDQTHPGEFRVGYTPDDILLIDRFNIGKDITDGRFPQSAAYLDIMGHEYTHSITHHGTLFSNGTNFNTNDESGGIMEAFCDYFGYKIAMYATGGYNDDMTPGSCFDKGFGHRTKQFARHFDDPSADCPLPGAAQYSDLSSIVGIADDRYRTSGILRHVLYLLEYGGDYNGIHIDPVANLERDAFIVMEWWSYCSMNYHDLAGSFIGEYAHYYGACSNQTQSVYKAWKAVGIDMGTPCSIGFTDDMEIKASDCTSSPIQIIDLGATVNYCEYSNVGTWNANWSLSLIATDGAHNNILSQSGGDTWALNLPSSSLPVLSSGQAWLRDVNGRIKGMIKLTANAPSSTGLPNILNTILNVGLSYAPDNLIVTGINPNTDNNCDNFLLQYTARGATSYVVGTRQQSCGTWSDWSYTTYSGSDYNVNYTGLDPSITYQYQVQAINSSGSITSDIVTKSPCCIYDINCATSISGIVTWTPTSNPTGVTSNNISFSNSITIPAGSSLTIQDMTINMAPGKSINVLNATDGISDGGILNINNSIITLFNSCDSPNTWNGIIVYGKQNNAQDAVSNLHSPQGKAILNNATISYATTGIANGDGNFSGNTASGGIIIANNSLFYNNILGVQLYPYKNMHGTSEVFSLEKFDYCTFNNDYTEWFTPYRQIEILGSIKGVGFNYCNFTNSTNAPFNIGILNIDAGVFIKNCIINGFNKGVLSSSFLGSCTPAISGTTFNNCNISVYSTGTIAPTIIGNTFNIPKYTGTTGTVIPGTSVVSVFDQNAGVVLKSSTGYTVRNNVFQTDASSESVTDNGYYAYTTGTIAYNTGSDNNSIENNTFTGVGVAMLSNFKNNGFSAGSGLQYDCNTDTKVGYDIAVVGNNIPDGGIKDQQCTFLLPTGALPANNKFSVHWNVYNQQQSFNYLYNVTDMHQIPYNNFGSITLSPYTQSGYCKSYASFPTSSGALVKDNNGHIIQSNENYAIATGNVHYYMTLNDTSSKPDLHRDSLYYWAGMMNSPYGDLLVSNLLIEDGLTDSALSVYTNILNKYKLDSAEANDFAQGKSIITILINHKLSKTDNYKLSTDEVSALRTVVSNTGMWAHARASAWLNVSVGDPMKDNLLYPGIPKTTPGVLAVTEISKGTAQYPNCQYAELLVANCGKDSANLVDISGWILDDNSDNFDNNVCDSNKGITRGHYRFANIDLWKYVPVGSMIIVYNANVNCYGLPDSFTIDTKNNIYWIPIYGIKKSWSYVMERYDGSENSSMCSYCSDTGTTVYTQAYGWATTVLLNDAHDAMQVRCPGCTTQNPNKPAFYQGIGYAKNSTSGFVTIKAGTNEAGGPVDYDRGKDASRFVFTGSTAADFASPANWQFYPEDSVYTIPTTLGNVSTNLAKLVAAHQLNMPCCNYSNPNGRYGNSAKTSYDGGGFEISVYPNPAQTVVNFLFSGNSDATIKLMDVTGRLLQQKVVSNSLLTTIGITGYMPGIYLYQVITNTKTQTGKIVIE